MTTKSPLFTKRHHTKIVETIAKTIDKLLGVEDYAALCGIDELAEQLITLFENDNPNFNRETFTNAIVNAAGNKALRADKETNR
jgi:hypothetical protein